MAGVGMQLGGVGERNVERSIRGDRREMGNLLYVSGAGESGSRGAIGEVLRSVALCSICDLLTFP